MSSHPPNGTQPPPFERRLQLVEREVFGGGPDRRNALRWYLEENNRVYGRLERITRNELHRFGLRHSYVVALLDDMGDELLRQRSKRTLDRGLTLALIVAVLVVRFA